MISYILYMGKMLKVTRKRKRKERRVRWIVRGTSFLVLFLTVIIFIFGIRNTTLWNRLQYQICYMMLKQYAPVLANGDGMQTAYNIEEDDTTMYDIQSESQLMYDQVLAKKEPQETQVTDDSGEDDGMSANQTDGRISQSGESGTLLGDAATASTQVGGNTVSLEKLNDFDYLIQHYYTVDKSTTINSSQLVVQNLLNKDCTIQKTTESVPQILIYHTHGSEGYVDSVPGDPNTSVIGVGNRLTQILQDTYGYHVLHETGIYDTDRDHAYNVAAPAIQKILQDHPSIEVVIDLHRDGVADTTRLATNINGVDMAQVMFFNGLSKTTATGDIDYLRNPYIEDNLAMSLKMQLAATELYPGFTRKIYLKSYRYNMHLCPKSLLIEVGAQTNTLQEAVNAMDPLAQVLDKVLSGK